VRQSLEVLAKQRKVPPLQGFRRLVKVGLIDGQGRLDRSHVQATTLGKLARGRRASSTRAVAGKIVIGMNSNGVIVIPPPGRRVRGR
jgi:hypothetical protein